MTQAKRANNFPAWAWRLACTPYHIFTDHIIITTVQWGICITLAKGYAYGTGHIGQNAETHRVLVFFIVTHSPL